MQSVPKVAEPHAPVGRSRPKYVRSELSVPIRNRIPTLKSTCRLGMSITPALQK